MFWFLVTKQQGTINKTMSCTNVSWCLSFLLGRPTRSCYQQTNDDLDCDSRPSWTVHRNRAGWLRENAEDAWKFTSIEGIQVMPPVKTNRNGFVAFPLIFSAPAIDLTQPECNNMFATRKGSTMLDGQLAMLVTCELRKCWPLYLLNQLLGTMFPPWTPKVKTLLPTKGRWTRPWAIQNER